MNDGSDTRRTHDAGSPAAVPRSTRPRDEPLDAGVFDRAVACAGHDDQTPRGNGRRRPAEVRGRVERVGAAGQQQRRHVEDPWTARIGRDSSFGTTRRARRKSLARATAA